MGGGLQVNHIKKKKISDLKLIDENEFKCMCLVSIEVIKNQNFI